MTDLGSSIRAIRERRGMKQAALARALEIAPQTLSNYELGPNKVPANKVPAIAKALGVSICGLYGVEEGHQVPAPLTVAQQLAQALGVEPGRIEVNVYAAPDASAADKEGRAVISNVGVPFPGAQSTKRLIEEYRELPEDRRQEWRELAAAIAAEEGRISG